MHSSGRLGYFGGNNKLIATVVLTFAIFMLPQTAHAVTIDPATRAFVIAEVRSAVEVYFSHWSGTSRRAVDAAFKRWIQEAYASNDRRAFDFATFRFFGTLRNGHTSFGDDWLDRLFGQDLGFYARPLDGRWTVIQSAIAGLRPGDALKSIDGEPIDEFARDKGQYLSASSTRQQELALFLRPYLFPQTFIVGVEGRPTVRVAKTPSAAQASQETESRRLRPDIGYVAVHSFGRERYETDAEDAVRRMSGARALIIDVRGNFGGNTPDDLTRLLMNEPFVGLSESSKIAVALYAADAKFMTGKPIPSLELAPPLADATLSWSAPPEEPAKDAFKGNVIVLADGECVSACEDFVSVFKISKRATIVGESTYGSTGQPYYEDLPDGMYFRIGAKRASFPDGSPFEGVGIAPDVIVQPTTESLRAGRDPVLEKALQLLGASSQ